MNRKSICLIPARGGSKRIPGKNIKLLAGKPLIQYTIDAALQSNCFESVVVSSEEDEILATARRCGAKTDKRPQELAGDSVKAVEVVAEYLTRKEHEGKWQSIVMCLPTCPFRVKEDIVHAMGLFDSKHENCPRLLGVTKCDFPPQLALQPGHDSETLDMREPEAYGFSTRSQDCQQLYFPNGSIYITTVKEFLTSSTFFGRPMLFYEMPPERSFDIDYPYQFDIAECLMSLKT